jgi:hypothetical protein
VSAIPLFGRTYTLTIGSEDFTDLRIAFDVKKTLKPDPNVCTIKLWNVTEGRRATLGAESKRVVRLCAGYRQQESQLYLGEILGSPSVINGPDIVTELTTGDSVKKVQKNNIYVPVTANAPIDRTLRDIVKVLNVGEGNLGRALTVIRAKGITTLFPAGGVIQGNAAVRMTDLCRSCGLEWSIQDGQVQILGLNKTLEEKAILVSSDTGMIGSPSINEKDQVEFEILLTPGLNPGAKVSIDSRYVKGGYRIIEANYLGDTHGNDWHAKIVAEKY